jgi:hypothetical protein
MTTLADEVRDFDIMVIPRGCPKVQEQEMVRSFYAGASSCMKIVFEISEIDDNDERMAATEALLGEMDQFAQKVGRGEA